MPSIKNITLAAAGLLGMATAFPQGGFQNTTTGAVGNNGTATGPVSGNNGTATGPVSGNNGTTTGPVSNNNGTTNGTNTADNSLFCPNLNAQVFVTPSSVSFIIECNTNHFGVVIDVEISGFNKRQAATAPTNLGDCLDLCGETATCVGTAFNSAAQSCTLFSSVGAAFTDADSSFGVRVADAAATTVDAGATLTSTVLQTNVVTISSCAPTVTNCPLNGAAVVTQVVAVASTEYICPAATVIPVAPVACGCAYSASTVTAYQATVVNGNTKVVVVSSTVVAVPQPSETGYSTTTVTKAAVACPTCPGGVSSGVATATGVACPTCPGGVSSGVATATGVAITSVATVCNGAYCPKASGTASSTMAVFTGAASNVKAGMGMGAVVAAAALLL